MRREGTRKNIIQPPEWWAAFQAAAMKSGKSLSAWIGDVCCEHLPASVRKCLPPRLGPGEKPKE